MVFHKYTKEQRAFIQNNYIGTGNVELTQIFNAEFNIDLTVKKMKAYKNNHNLNSGLTGRFNSEQIPWNKGKKGLKIAGSEKGWFKKGREPFIKKPISAERVCKKDGYVSIKVSYTGTYQQQWKLKHRVLWERENGPIPKGYRLKFLNGDRTDCRLKNLSLISYAALVRFNQGGMDAGDLELNRTNVLIAEVLSKQHKKERGNHDGKASKENIK